MVATSAQRHEQHQLGCSGRRVWGGVDVGSCVLDRSTARVEVRLSRGVGMTKMPDIADHLGWEFARAASIVSFGSERHSRKTDGSLGRFVRYSTSILPNQTSLRLSQLTGKPSGMMMAGKAGTESSASIGGGGGASSCRGCFQNWSVGEQG